MALVGGLRNKVNSQTVMVRKPQRKLNRRQVKQVQKIVEKNKLVKQLYVDITSSAFNAGTLINLTTISKGDEFNQRDTDRISVQSIKLNFAIDNEGATGPDVIRFMVVRSKRGPLTVADLPSTLVATPDIDKMQVYTDQIYGIGFLDGATGVADLSVITGNYFKSFKNKKVPHLNVIFDETVSATLAQTNPLYLYLLSAGATPALTGYSRIKWFDKD